MHLKPDPLWLQASTLSWLDTRWNSQEVLGSEKGICYIPTHKSPNVWELKWATKTSSVSTTVHAATNSPAFLILKYILPFSIPPPCSLPVSTNCKRNREVLCKVYKHFSIFFSSKHFCVFQLYRKDKNVLSSQSQKYLLPPTYYQERMVWINSESHRELSSSQ